MPVYLVSVPRDSKAGYLPDSILLQVADYVSAKHNGLLTLQTASSTDAVRRLSYHRPCVSAGAATGFPVRFNRTKPFVLPHAHTSAAWLIPFLDTLSPRLWYASPCCHRCREQAISCFRYMTGRDRHFLRCAVSVSPKLKPGYRFRVSRRRHFSLQRSA